MIRLLIIADDITGALDTGAIFVEYGKTPTIFVGTQIDLSKYRKTDVEILVLDTETRHLSSQEAYQIVYDIVSAAVREGIHYIYKKTDSVLRGNIASEISAVLDGSKEKFIAFVPAYPAMKRITINGVHYVQGIPLRESFVGKDPFEPTEFSYIPDMFQDVSTKIRVYKKSEQYDLDMVQKSIGIFDAETNEDLLRIARVLKKQEKISITAGCAGFASAMAVALGLHKKHTKTPKYEKKLLVICGSVNPITKKQIDFAQESGFYRVTLSVKQLLEPDFLTSEDGKKLVEIITQKSVDGSSCIIDTQIRNLERQEIHDTYGMKKIGLDIAVSLGKLTRKLLEQKPCVTLVIIGGDTLLGCLKNSDSKDVKILCNLYEGVVLSEVHISGMPYNLISKSGGFGEMELFKDLVDSSDKKSSE